MAYSDSLLLSYSELFSFVCGFYVYGTDILTFLMKKKLYIDTSVIGGYFDEEFELDTKLFFNRIFEKEFDVYISDISLIELLPAPLHVQEFFASIPKECLFTLEFNDEAKELANTYLIEKILGKASFNDACHIAIASVHSLDVLVSWNFKHIVNLDKILLFNEVNKKLGYSTIDIRPPKELIKYED